MITWSWCVSSQVRIRSSRAVAAAGAKAAYSSRYKKLEVPSRQKSSSVAQSPAVDSLAWTTVAAPAATSVQG